jgi:hypothetical protein
MSGTLILLAGMAAVLAGLSRGYGPKEAPAKVKKKLKSAPNSVLGQKAK